jgi:hypothetical protein
MRKSYEVIGYTYEADCHCLDCAGKRFPENDRCELYGTDREGNEIHPIFFDTEFDSVPVCGDCFEILAD